MKYQLYNEYDDASLSTVNIVLENRGMPLEDQTRYLAASYKDIHGWKDFGVDDMAYAVKKLVQALEDESPIFILKDPDVDGYTSTAILINYINRVYPDYVSKGLITIGEHDGKQHGLADVMDQIPPWTRLVICPDSASSDFEQHKTLLNEFGVDAVIVLDHHHCDEMSEWATVINNQMCDYPNKALTGAGVAWQFCRAVDELIGEGIFDDNPYYLLDLCALGNIADMADYREVEIKAIVREGMSHITNPFIKCMVEKNEYSMEKRGGLTYMAFAFYVVPYINAICRSGTMDEKKLVFDAMLEHKANTMVPNKARGHSGEKTELVNEAIRTAFNVKTRQTKDQDAAMETIRAKIVKYRLDKNPVIVVICDEDDAVKPTITGLVANKVQSEYKKPTIIVNENGDAYQGSGRNYGKSPIEDFRLVCESTDAVNFAQGHAGSFGISVNKDNLDDFLDKVEQAYDGIDMVPTYYVDFIIKDFLTKGPKIITDIFELKDLWGQQLQEAYVVIKSVPLNNKNVFLLSPDKNPTLKIKCGNVDIMKFKSSEEEYRKFTSGNQSLVAVCSCSVNEWNGTVTPQLIIEDYELQQEWIF